MIHIDSNVLDPCRIIHLKALQCVDDTKKGDITKPDNVNGVQYLAYIFAEI